MPEARVLKRVVKRPQNYKNLGNDTDTRRLLRDMVDIVDRINENFDIKPMPLPQNFSATISNSYCVIVWDDIDDDSRYSLDGAMIWRADAAQDPNTNFYKNNAKITLVSCSRVNRYVDIEASAGEWIYWVQWINRDGFAGKVAGGVKITVS